MEKHVLNQLLGRLDWQRAMAETVERRFGGLKTAIGTPRPG